MIDLDRHEIAVHQFCSIPYQVVSKDTDHAYTSAEEAAEARPALKEAAKFAAIANKFLTEGRRLQTNVTWRALEWHPRGRPEPYEPWSKVGGAEPNQYV